MPSDHDLLHAGHALERQFQPEVAARDHDGVRFGDDFLDVRHRVGLSSFATSERCSGVRSAQFFASLSHVGRRLHEAEPDEVDACGNSELQVLDVLGGKPGRRQMHTGTLMPLCSPSSPPSTTRVRMSPPRTSSTRN